MQGRRKDLHGDGDLVGALVGWTEQPPGGLPLLAQQGNGLRHGHILEAGMEDGAAHKLLLALASVALSLQVWARAWVEVKGSLGSP